MKQNTALARTAAVEESRKVKEENINIKKKGTGGETVDRGRDSSE